MFVLVSLMVLVFVFGGVRTLAFYEFRSELENARADRFAFRNAIAIYEKPRNESHAIAARRVFARSERHLAF